MVLCFSTDDILLVSDSSYIDDSTNHFDLSSTYFGHVISSFFKRNTQCDRTMMIVDGFFGNQVPCNSRRIHNQYVLQIKDKLCRTTSGSIIIVYHPRKYYPRNFENRSNKHDRSLIIMCLVSINSKIATS